MPTAEEFDHAAVRFAGLAHDVRAAVGPVASAMGPQVMSGGALTAGVQASVTEVSLLVSRASAELDELAELARHRAGVVRAAAAARRDHHRALEAYRAALGEWRRAHERWSADPRTQPWPGIPPPEPGPPPAPPPWADP